MSSGDQLSQGGQEQLPENRSFSEVVKNQIDRLPAPVPQTDPYAPDRKSIGIPIEIRFDYSYSGNGRVRFGKMFDTRQLWVEGLEVTLAWNKKTGKGEVLVHQFDDSGLATRTWFKETDDGNVEKIHIEGPWGLSLGMLGQGPQIRRGLSDDETKMLKRIMTDPLHNADSFYAWVTPTEDEATDLEVDRARLQADREKLQADLKAIDEMHRRGWEESADVWLG